MSKANVQGWRQFITAKEEMLNSYDRSKIISKGHKVQTFHGTVAEAEFRKWLSNFLPKKYAVTSGYIVSTENSEDDKLPHYDVIIYEHLEAPVLWIENNPDNSEQGRSLAIPAEYVQGVIEVKSSFDRKTVKDAIEHLKDLKKLMDGIDPINTKYGKFLPRTFFCSIVFFEIREANKYDDKALESIIDGIELRGFEGGVVLRGESKSPLLTGRLKIMTSQAPMEGDIKKPERSILKHNSTFSKSRKISKDFHYIGHIAWFQHYFADYAFDMIARMNGTYQLGKVSSFHGLGQSLEE